MIIQKRIEEISGNWKMHLWFLALLQIFKVLVLLRIFKTIYVLPYFLREKVLRKIYSLLTWFYCSWPKGTFTNLQFFGPVSRTFHTSKLYFCIFRLSQYIQYLFIHSYYPHPHKYFGDACIPPLISQLKLFWLLRQQVALKSSLHL